MRSYPASFSAPYANPRAVPPSPYIVDVRHRNDFLVTSNNFSRPGSGALPSHVIPMSSNYPSRGTTPPLGYTSRPLVLSIPHSVSNTITRQNNRHYNASTTTTTISNTDLNRSNAASVLNNQSRPEDSPNTQTKNTVSDSPPSVNSSRNKLTEEELRNPATIQNQTSQNVDKEMEIMAEGLRIQQQEWRERSELKKLFNDTAKLNQLFIQLTKSKTVSREVLDEITELVNDYLPQALDRLAERVQIFMSASDALELDSKAAITEVQNTAFDNECLVTRDLSQAHKVLNRAKRVKNYRTQYEELAKKIITKKPKTETEKDLSIETTNLDSVKAEVEKWKKISIIRKQQIEGVATQIRHLLGSLHNPEELLNFVAGERAIDNIDSELTDEH